MASRRAHGVHRALAVEGNADLQRQRDNQPGRIHQSVVNAARRAPGAEAAPMWHRCVRVCSSAPHLASCAVTHRVVRVGLVPRQALGLMGTAGQQRVHAHQRQSPFRGELVEHPPTVPGRFARHRHRHRTQWRPLDGPNPAATRAPTPATSRAVAPQSASRGRQRQRPACHRPLTVGTHDRGLKWAATRAAGRAARCGRDHPERRAPSFTDVLLDAWDTKPSNRIRTTSLHPALTR